MTAMSAPKHHNHTTIANQYHALYSDDVMVRIDAYYAEQERQMRECMGNRNNYDLDGVRAVVANWEKHCPNGNAHRVALAVLAERLAELEPQTIAATMRQLIELRDHFDKQGEGELRDQATDLINAYGAKILRDHDAAQEAAQEAELATWLDDQDAADWEREQAAVRRAENGGQPTVEEYAGLPDEDGRRRYDPV